MSTSPETVAMLAEAMAELSETMGPINDMVDGVRADAIRREYSPTVAEAMALACFQMLMAIVATNQGQQPP